MKLSTRSQTLLWLSAGVAGLLLANGRWSQPWGAWVALFCLLRFAAAGGPWLGFGAITAAGFGVNLLVWQGVLPLPSPLYQIVCGVGAVFLAVPILLHRLIAPRLSGAVATLVYPCALVATQYLHSLISPSGTYGSIAYSQTFGPLLQVVSLGGIWALLFFLGWSVSVADRWLRREAMGRGLLVYGGVALAVLGYGGLRWHGGDGAMRTVQVAGLVGAFNYDRAIKDDVEAFRQAARDAGRRLLERSTQEAAAGARIVFWQEAALPLLKDEESVFLAAAADCARAHRIFLGVSLFVLTPEFPRKWASNKIVWLDPDGKRVIDYAKAYPTPAEAVVRGPEKIETVASELGRLGSVICFDMDFPAFLRQAGRQRADLLCVPANDWREITPYHAHIARFRAIEQGFALVRTTGNGQSVACDSSGRELAALTLFDNAAGVLRAEVPVVGRRTLYTLVGDAWVAVCVGGLAVLAVLALRWR